jgi:SM-20-related protein
MSSPAADYLLALASALEAAGDGNRAAKVRDLAAAREARAADAVSRKGDLLRSQGQLRQAADVFVLVDHRQPDHPRARYLSALLQGLDAPLPALRPAPWPAAFVRIEDFLDHVRHDEILDLRTSPGHAFEPSTVGGIGPHGPEPRVDLAVRNSFRVTKIASVSEWLGPLIETCLPAISARLGVAPFPVAAIELKCTAYGDGSFFRVHSDSRNHPLRRISFVYYFHQQPKPYTGGALLLYDGDVADPTRYFEASHTRLETLDNSIVFFPSGTYHEVTPVVSPSGRWEDARFTIAGHVHTFEPDGGGAAASPE